MTVKTNITSPTFSVTLLGTGGPKPDIDRQASTVLITHNSKNYLIDAGRGVTTRLLEAGVNPQDLDAIFITHHHFDHIGNLGDLLLTIWNNGRKTPLQIIGPAGTKDIIQAMFERVYVSDIKFRYREAEITGDTLARIENLFEVVDMDAGKVFSAGALNVSAERVSHGHDLGMSFEEWPCLGYRFTTDDKSIAVSGDTVDCPGLGVLAKNTNLLILCCYLAHDEQSDFEKSVVSKHIILSSKEAGKIATKYDVKKLVLTHIRQKPPNMLEAMRQDIAADYTGEIFIGKDLMTFLV